MSTKDNDDPPERNSKEFHHALRRGELDLTVSDAAHIKVRFSTKRPLLSPRLEHAPDANAERTNLADHLVTDMAVVGDVGLGRGLQIDAGEIGAHRGLRVKIVEQGDA